MMGKENSSNKEFEMPAPLPLPVVEAPVEGENVRNDIRATGFSGDITRFPLSRCGYLYRCNMAGADPYNPPNPAWYYAPNAWVQNDLHEKGTQ